MALQAALNTIHQWLFQDKFEVDSSTHTFFIFKHYPSEIKPADRDAWAKLQVELLCPFDEPFFYLYKSKNGIHIWFAKTPFNGIPETACQVPEEDGNTSVHGKHFTYHQQWQFGTLHACIATPNAQDTGSQLVLTKEPWAKEAAYKTTLYSAKFWALASLGVFALFMSWLAVGYLTLVTQLKIVDTNNIELNAQVGDKLALQQTLSNAQTVVSTIHNWKTDSPNMVTKLGDVLGGFENQEALKVLQVQWSNSMLELQFEQSNVNITRLVEQVEALTQVLSVNINPSTRQNQWSLTVRWNT